MDNNLMMRKRCLTMVLSILYMSSFAQYHYILESLKATKDKEKVILTWTIKTGNTCEGIGILRSTDGLQYDPIGKIFGVCGSTEFPQTYYYIDESPLKNKINYYVLELGLSGRSNPPLSIEIIGLDGKSSKVVPNPAQDMVKIYFINPNYEEYLISIFDTNGKFIYKGNTSDDCFVVDFTHTGKIEAATFNFDTAKYHYLITDKNNQKITSGVFFSLAH